MPLAHFEEKEIEGPLNGELTDGPLWSPGPVLEKIVGFDAAMRVSDAAFWAARGYSAPPTGAAVSPSWWPHASAHLLAKRSPPPFALNVFLQYKRPEFLSRNNAHEWSHWNAAYFRFWATPHQQLALEACATALGNKGLVAYASPAFYTRAALWEHVAQQTLRANTHFAPATKLTGHDGYTYLDALKPGIAHSVPTFVEPLRFLSGGGNGDWPPNRLPGGADSRRPEQLLADARRAAQAAIAASPQLVGNEALFTAAVDRAMIIVRQVDAKASDPVRDFVSATTFSMMSGIQWAVLPAARTTSKASYRSVTP